MNNTISIIIPAYNEEKVIADSLESLSKQTMKNIEIIVVDDGSTDDTLVIIQNSKFKIQNLILLQQKHKGPGAARNMGATKAKGDILVFVDADMEFAPNFLEKLVEPIQESKSIGTFSKEEYLLNRDNANARCWNLNLGRKFDQMIPDSYPIESPVFRAIPKKKFDEVGGFDTTIGYTDDWSLSKKLGIKAQLAKGAIFYHRNPETLNEVWTQARWYGKNEFLTGSLVRKIYNLFRYFPPFALAEGIIGAVQFKEPQYFAFKIIYDSAVFLSVCKSFFAEEKFR